MAAEWHCASGISRAMRQGGYCSARTLPGDVPDCANSSRNKDHSSVQCCSLARSLLLLPPVPGSGLFDARVEDDSLAEG